MISCFKDPRFVLEQAFKHLAPGGYLEMQDTDFPMKCVDDTISGTALWDWNQYIIDGSARAGRPWTRVKEYKKWMIEIGFVDVEEKVLQWPINTWPRDTHLKKLGLWFQHDLTEGLSSTRAVLTRGLGVRINYTYFVHIPRVFGLYSMFIIDPHAYSLLLICTQRKLC